MWRAMVFAAMCGWSVAGVGCGGSVIGYQWGLVEFPGEVDVSPGSTGG